MNWRVKLNGADITAYCSGFKTRFEAGAICGEVEIALASRAPLAGIVAPRVPRSLSIAVDERDGVAWVSRGEYFLDEIQYPNELDAKTATLWGRSLSARLTSPWAAKISRQWSDATTVADIVAELAAATGVTVTLSNDFDVCAYCYVAADRYPSEIMQELAEMSGQTLWPQTDGSLIVGPIDYSPAPTPDVVLSPDDIIVESVDRQVPDFGNRVNVTATGAVSGISVTVAVLDDTSCVAADGSSQLRVVAVATDSDGSPLADGTDVAWSASGGTIPETSTIQAVTVQESGRATNYTTIATRLPIRDLIGVYYAADTSRSVNLVDLLAGAGSGTTISFARPLRNYNSAVTVVYETTGAPNLWTAGWTPGEVTITASVAGAAGSTTVYQSDPTACASEMTIITSDDDPCLGDTVNILLIAAMFGGAAVGVVTASLAGCGSLDASSKTLAARTVEHELSTSIWGGVDQITLPGYLKEGATPSVWLSSDASKTDIFDAISGRTVTLTTSSTSGTKVTVRATYAGTAVFTWTPSSVPSGYEHIRETLAAYQDDGVAYCQLSRTPAENASTGPSIEWSLNEVYGSHDSNNVAALLEVMNNPVPDGDDVRADYYTVWAHQSDCVAVITFLLADGAEDGGTTITLTARDCREVGGCGDDDSLSCGDDNPDETTDDEDDDEDEDVTWPKKPKPPVTATGCDSDSIVARTPEITGENWGAVAAVDCTEAGDAGGGGLCTPDEICAALRAAGKLAGANIFYSQCVDYVTDARADRCTPCELDGPTVLAPGAYGVWTDGKTNSGEWSGDLVLKDRTFENGYNAKMPTSGAGPFTVRVCYGDTEADCCEAQVAFPACTLSGPSELVPGVYGEYTPSIGTTGITVTAVGMTYTIGSAVIRAKLNAGACNGSLTVTFGGQICGSINVTSSVQYDTLACTGPTALEPGAYDVFVVASADGNLDGLTYTGNLEVMSHSGGSYVLRMPSDAVATGDYYATWTASCGRHTGMDVLAIQDVCTYGISLNCGHGSLSPGDIVNYQGVCYTVGPQCDSAPHCGDDSGTCTDKSNTPYHHIHSCGVVVCPSPGATAPVYSLIPL